MDTWKSRAYEEQATRCCPLRPTPLQLLLPTGWLALVREEPWGGRQSWLRDRMWGEDLSSRLVPEGELPGHLLHPIPDGRPWLFEGTVRTLWLLLFSGSLTATFSHAMRPTVVGADSCGITVTRMLTLENGLFLRLVYTLWIVRAPDSAWECMRTCAHMHACTHIYTQTHSLIYASYTHPQNESVTLCV